MGNRWRLKVAGVQGIWGSLETEVGWVFKIPCLFLPFVSSHLLYQTPLCSVPGIGDAIGFPNQELCGVTLNWEWQQAYELWTEGCCEELDGPFGSMA